MAFKLPPPPQNNDLKGAAWQDWFFKLARAFTSPGSAAWSSLDFTGSNLLNIQTRNHNDLQNIQGGAPGDYQHLTAAQVASIGGGSHSDTYSYQVPSNGFTITVPALTDVLILAPAGDLSTGTVIMPASPVDGQHVVIASTKNIAAVSIQPNTGQTVINAPSAFQTH